VAINWRLTCVLVSGVVITTADVIALSFTFNNWVGKHVAVANIMYEIISN